MNRGFGQCLLLSSLNLSDFLTYQARHQGSRDSTITLIRFAINADISWI